MQYIVVNAMDRLGGRPKVLGDEIEGRQGASEKGQQMSKKWDVLFVSKNNTQPMYNFLHSGTKANIIGNSKIINCKKILLKKTIFYNT
jgi:hypothetical protein